MQLAQQGTTLTPEQLQPMYFPHCTVDAVKKQIHRAKESILVDQIQQIPHQPIPLAPAPPPIVGSIGSGSARCMY